MRRLLCIPKTQCICTSSSGTLPTNGAQSLFTHRRTSGLPFPFATWGLSSPPISPTSSGSTGFNCTYLISASLCSPSLVHSVISTQEARRLLSESRLPLSNNTAVIGLWVYLPGCRMFTGACLLWTLETLAQHFILLIAHTPSPFYNLVRVFLLFLSFLNVFNFHSVLCILIGLTCPSTYFTRYLFWSTISKL